MQTSSLLTILRHDVLTLTLNRPQARNALDGPLIAALTQAFEQVPKGARTIVLLGAGASFCAGADLAWMAEPKGQHPGAAPGGATGLQRLFAAIAQAPQVVVAVGHGPVRGGGAGLLCAADIVLAGHSLSVAFPETALGLVPAIIAPYVVARIGPGQARHLFLTGESIDASRAQALGLVHEQVADAELPDALAHVLKRLHNNGPNALAATKKLLLDLTQGQRQDVAQLCVDVLDAVRAHPEAQEGCAAFLARRAPTWRPC